MAGVATGLNLAMYLVLSLVVLAIMLSFGGTTQTKLQDMSTCPTVGAAASSGALYMNTTTHVCQNSTGTQFLGYDVNITSAGTSGILQFGSFMPTIFLIAVIVVVLVLLLAILPSIGVGQK